MEEMTLDLHGQHTSEFLDDQTRIPKIIVRSHVSFALDE